MYTERNNLDSSAESMLSKSCLFIIHEEGGKLADLQNVGLRMEEACSLCFIRRWKSVRMMVITKMRKKAITLINLNR